MICGNEITTVERVSQQILTAVVGRRAREFIAAQHK